jgi:hypothetical protein
MSLEGQLPGCTKSQFSLQVSASKKSISQINELHFKASEFWSIENLPVTVHAGWHWHAFITALTVQPSPDVSIDAPSSIHHSKAGGTVV